MGRVLIVDDEPGLRQALQALVEAMGHSVTTASQQAEALECLKSQSFDVVVTDLRLEPDGDGMRVLKAARNLAIPLDVIVMTAYGTRDKAREAIREGAAFYLEKGPHIAQDLEVLLRQALHTRRVQAENEMLRRMVDDEGDAGFISHSKSMIEVREMVERLAGMPTTVLISGESGTGKERIARALHKGGQRTRDVFIPLNCGAIPETLIESELFGHVRGAFTGADKDREGVILAARGGTLFLDEIGELPMALQPKLLRVLQEKKVRPVGSEKEINVDDVRMVAATNRDLEAEVRIGRFREDLYFRLNVVEVALPPLRQRRADIAPLAYGFLKKFSKRYPRQVTEIASEAMAVLMSYAYPGNVRQLENAMERCVALARSSCVSVNDLPKEFLTKLGGRGPSGLMTADMATFPEAGVDLARLVEKFEYQWIQQALEAAGGVKTRAAELLNLSFRQFRYKLSKYGDSEPHQGSMGDDT